MPGLPSTDEHHTKEPFAIAIFPPLGLALPLLAVDLHDDGRCP